ncbi:hypothetical protein ON010_g834 [Phytophthora cinnamomi]|nr:hypothetical protein ON010_g834 [Phytophthora cinnamomi]
MGSVAQRHTRGTDWVLYGRNTHRRIRDNERGRVRGAAGARRHPGDVGRERHGVHGGDGAARVAGARRRAALHHADDHGQARAGRRPGRGRQRVRCADGHGHSHDAGGRGAHTDGRPYPRPTAGERLDRPHRVRLRRGRDGGAVLCGLALDDVALLSTRTYTCARGLWLLKEWKTKLYTPRLRTNEAYRIYIEKDPAVRLASACCSCRTIALRCLDMEIPAGRYPLLGCGRWLAGVVLAVGDAVDRAGIPSPCPRAPKGWLVGRAFTPSRQAMDLSLAAEC